MSEEYREAFGSHAYDTEGNYIGGLEYGEFTPETEAQAAWAEYATEVSAKAPDGDETATDEDAAPVAEVSEETAVGDATASEDDATE